jgi:hypothetical protein
MLNFSDDGVVLCNRTRLRRHSNARFIFHLPIATLQVDIEVDVQDELRSLLVNKIPSVRVAGLTSQSKGRVQV